MGLVAWLCLFVAGLIWLTAGSWPADDLEGMRLNASFWLLLAQAGLMLSVGGLVVSIPRPLRLLALLAAWIIWDLPARRGHA